MKSLYIRLLLALGELHWARVAVASVVIASCYDLTSAKSTIVVVYQPRFNALLMKNVIVMTACGDAKDQPSLERIVANCTCA